MAVFVKATNAETGKFVWLAIANVRLMRPSDKGRGTIVVFESGSRILVRQTPEQISEAAQAEISKPSRLATKSS
jgi:hypothetical protein